MIEEKIVDLVNEAIVTHGLDDCFLVDVKVNNIEINVFFDCDSGVTFDKCRKVSRHLEAVLDEKKWLGEKYILNVGSPGVGRPLKMLRQYKKNIGRMIVVKTEEGKKTKGKLTGVTEDHIIVTYSERKKEGKKKRTVEINEVIDFDSIKEAKIKVSF